MRCNKKTRDKKSGRGRVRVWGRGFVAREEKSFRKVSCKEAGAAFLSLLQT